MRRATSAATASVTCTTSISLRDSLTTVSRFGPLDGNTDCTAQPLLVAQTNMTLTAVPHRHIRFPAFSFTTAREVLREIPCSFFAGADARPMVDHG